MKIKGRGKSKKSLDSSKLKKLRENRRNKVRKERKIFVSIMVCFCIPILLIVVLGYSSFKMASHAVMKKYEDVVFSASSSMKTSLGLICDSVVFIVLGY